jgi:monoamine oxidase
MGLTRREFIARVGQAGGYSAAFLSLRAMGLGQEAMAASRSIAAAPGVGKGTRVVVLGGGIAGLVAGYELGNLGYRCTVLEARERPGGRNWTVRGGDKVVFTDGSAQTCDWAAGSYQNFGPARLPSVHDVILGYCRKLGVDLQVEVNTSRCSHLQSDAANGGQPMVQRQVINDTRGHVAELLMKCVHAGELDAELSPDDRTRMLEFLRIYGPLDAAGKYLGSDRAGFRKPPGAGEDAGVLAAPVDMHTLLAADFWQGILFEEAFDMQATMFQPVGGMDRLPYAFAKALGKTVRYNAPVTEIRRTDRGVRVSYLHDGAPAVIEAEYCVCAMPLQILKNIPSDFSPQYKKIISECTYAEAYKIAWESRRFWETEDHIYGGLEFISEGPSPIWFPSGGMFSERGVLVSGYTDERKTPFRELSVREKFEASRASIEKLHPGRGTELEKPMYVGWGRVPYNEGSWIQTYGPGQERAPGAGISRVGTPTQPTEAATRTNPGYETLIQPDGPVFFVGDHASHLVGWQQGAALSSLRAVQMITERTQRS